MKPSVAPLILLIPLAVSMEASAAVLVGFYDFDGVTTAPSEAASYTATNFTGTLLENTNSVNQGGSNDNFYGNSSLSVPSPQPAGDGFVRVTGTATFTVTYSALATVPANLAAIAFDTSTTATGSALNVFYSINGAADVKLTATAISPNYYIYDGALDNATTGYDDYSFSLAGISLAPGDSIAFKFTQSTGNFRLDNVAVTDAIPEPVTAMLAALGLAGLMRRTR